MKKLLILACFSVPVTALADAPFCAVTGAGTQCYYWSLSACQQAIRGLDGACVAQVQQQAQVVQPVYQAPAPYQVQIQHPNIMESFQRGQEAGMRARQAREAQEEHQARMRLIEAQTEAAQSQQQRFWQQPQQQAAEAQEAPAQGEYYRAIYKCGDAPTYTPIPAPGCVVVSVYP